ncbi:hypothetical protein V6N11_016526 [Hibiscus sabdariffa]|uniref:Uncharacterized protein n=1 Tax=Hibiscus sabdariffa TaxID=183260 RepID=A0ABR2TVV9_9ROSI
MPNVSEVAIESLSIDDDSSSPGFFNKQINVHSASESDALHFDTYPEAFSVPPSEEIPSTNMGSTRVIDAGCTSSEPVVAPVLEEPLLSSPCLSPSLLSQGNEMSVNDADGSTEHVQNQAPESLDDGAMNNEPLADVPICTKTNSNVHSMITRSKAAESQVADIFTKAIAAIKFEEFRSQLSVISFSELETLKKQGEY